MNSKILVAFIIASFAVCTYAEPGCGGCDIEKPDEKSFQIDPESSDHEKWFALKTGDAYPSMEDCIATIPEGNCFVLKEDLLFQYIEFKGSKKDGMFGMPLSGNYSGQDFENLKNNKDFQAIVGPTGLLKLHGTKINKAGEYCSETDTVDISDKKDKMKLGKGTTTLTITIKFDKAEFKGKLSSTLKCK